jgi:hypothetical protein
MGSADSSRTHIALGLLREETRTMADYDYIIVGSGSDW